MSTATAPATCMVSENGFAEDRIKVLLIEDMPMDAKLIENALSTAPSRFAVRVAKRLQDAVEALSEGGYHVILSDLSLPDGNGTTTVERISQASAGTPLIILTSLAEEEMALQLLDQGVQDYLLKDEITPKTLDRAIHYAMQRQRCRGEIEQLLSQVQDSRRLLERKNRRLARLYKTAQRFVSNVSHEFRTPLTVIKEYTDILREGILGEVTSEQCRYLDVVVDRADDLNRMVDDMLDVSKIEAGLLGAWRSECRVTDVLEHVRPSLVKKAELKKVTLEISIPDDLPMVYCDAEKIGRVIVNLAVNAIKFCGEPGRVWIWAKVSESDKSAVIGVTDNGPGIDPSFQETIFERFKQLGTESRGSTKGFGLGLNIAQELVDLNFGQISLESRRGAGSTFSFTLPLAEPEEVIRRYVERIRKRNDKHTQLSVIEGQIDKSCAPSLADDVDAFFNYLLRRNDLLFRTNSHQWLLIVPEPDSELVLLFDRYDKQRNETNRNRPHGPLPKINLQSLGTWPASANISSLINMVRTTMKQAEEIHA